MRLPRFVVLLLFFALPALRAAPEAGRYLRAADIEVTANRPATIIAMAAPLSLWVFMQ